MRVFRVSLALVCFAAWQTPAMAQETTLRLVSAFSENSAYVVPFAEMGEACQ